VSIKGEGYELSGKGKKKKRNKHKTGVLSTLAINISSNTPPFSSLETWVQFPLS
jgi:predicted nucleic acid binding AN1-type Zn finger protein